MIRRLAVTTGAVGCLYIEKPWDPTTTCEEYLCPIGTNAAPYLVLDGAQLITCWGEGNMPSIVANNCGDPPPEACSIPLTSLECQRVTPTVDALTPEAAVVGCAELEWELTDGSNALVADALSEATSGFGCFVQILEDHTLDACVQDPSAQAEYLQECDEGTRLAAPPGSQYEMIIDPQWSYVHAEIGLDVLSSTLAGSSFASTSPQGFVLALAWGEDRVFDGDMTVHNHVVLSAPVLVEGAGTTYHLPTTQDTSLVLQGVRGATPYVLEFDPSVPSGGSFDTTAGTWDYTYTQSVPGSTIEVHLEGPLIATSLP